MDIVCVLMPRATLRECVCAPCICVCSLCTRKCVKCVLLSFLGLPSFTHLCWMSDGDSLFTFPSSACQWLQCGLSAQQAPYINLIPIWSSSDQLRDHLTALSWLFHFHRSGALRLVISFFSEFAVRMLREDVLAHMWCISLHSNRSLNSSFWSAWEPHRILVRYSWKMKYITSIPEAQIPDGTQWLEGDMAIFSSTAPA